MKFADFVNANRPTNNTISMDEIRIAATKANLGIGYPDNREVRISNSKGVEMRFQNRSSFDLYWTVKIEGMKLIFTPYLSSTMSSGYSSTLVEQPLFEQLGIGQIVVHLPEPVVQLDIPAWIEVISDDAYASSYSKQMFLSETRESLEAYYQSQIKLLAKMTPMTKEEAEKYSADTNANIGWDYAGWGQIDQDIVDGIRNGTVPVDSIQAKAVLKWLKHNSINHADGAAFRVLQEIEKLGVSDQEHMPPNIWAAFL